MKRTWAPAKLVMGLSRQMKPPLSKLASKGVQNTTQTMVDLLVGGTLAVGLYTVVSPRSVLPNTPTVGARPEAALIAGLVASGGYWFVTGENVQAISGAAATLFIYGLSKLAFNQ